MVISFFRGHPSDNLLPSEAILKAAQSVLACTDPAYEHEDNRHPLAYGTDEGARWVRDALATWTNETLGGSSTAELVNLTNGASFGAASALLQCTSRTYTRQAFAISPTYFLINNIFEDAGFGIRETGVSKMTAIVENDQGLDLDSLENWLKNDSTKFETKTSAKKAASTMFTYVLYIVPTFSNPGGYTVSLAERQRLLQIARMYDLLIICDEVYNWLDFYGTHKHEKLLVTLDQETLPSGSVGNVIGNFTMSKIMGPGLRVGWQIAATEKLAHHLSQTGATISGGTPAQLNTFIVGELISQNLISEVIANLNKVYGERSKAYRKAISTNFPEGTRIFGGDGGYFLWVTIPNGYDVKSISAECKQHGIIVASGDNFEVKGDSKNWVDNSFRVSLSYVTAEIAVPAIEKWAQIIAKNKI